MYRTLGLVCAIIGANLTVWEHIGFADLIGALLLMVGSAIVMVAE